METLTENNPLRPSKITQLILCGHGRTPTRPIQRCLETLIIMSDGSWRHEPDGVQLSQDMERVGVSYGRCREHGRVAVYNAIPPVE